MEHNCMRVDIINDLKERVVKLEENDREDYGSRRELAESIKSFAVSNERQAQAIADISETLIKVNSNLDSLNKDNKEIRDDVIELKSDVYNKFDRLESKYNTSEEKNKIDIRDWFKSNIMKITISGASIVGVVIAILKAFKII